jgi:hypothetical protein
MGLRRVTSIFRYIKIISIHGGKVDERKVAITRTLLGDAQ